MRIIPTRMGTSRILNSGFLVFWDHPHAYGDKQKFTMLYKDNNGSSPRVWGQEYKQFTKYGLHRIIPTRMGTRS